MSRQGDSAIHARAFSRVEYRQLHRRFQAAYSDLPEAEQNDIGVRTQFLHANLTAGAGGWSCEMRGTLTTISRNVRIIGGKDSIAYRENSPLVHRLFGFGRRVQFAPGVISPHYPDYSAHNDKITSALVSSISADTELAVLQTKQDELLFPDTRDATTLAIGGPVSHALSRLILGYFEQFREGSFSLSRIKMPYFDFPFEYIVDSEWLLRNNLVAEFKKSLMVRPIPNWLIREADSKNLYVPSFAGGEQITDFLLVTVIPNFLDRQAYDRGHKIVILGGAHGLGTRSVAKLLAHKDALSRLIAMSETFVAWQAIVPVSLNPIDELGLSLQLDEINVRQVEVVEKRLPHHAVDRLLIGIGAPPLGNQKTDAKTNASDAADSERNQIDTTSVTDKGIGRDYFVEEAPTFRDVNARRLDDLSPIATAVQAGGDESSLLVGGSPSKGAEQMSTSEDVIHFRSDIQDYRLSETSALMFDGTEQFDDAVEQMYQADLDRIPHAFLNGIALHVPNEALPILEKFFADRRIFVTREKVYSSADLTPAQYAELLKLKSGVRHTD